MPLNSATATTPTGEPVLRVDVRDDNGGITFLSGAPGSVTRIQQWNFVPPSYSQTLSDGALLIRAKCPESVPMNDCSTSLLITVPPTVGIDAHTVNGTVCIAVCSSADATRADGTNVDIPGFSSSDVTAVSSNGDIRVSLLSPPSNLSMSTINGGILASVPVGSYALSTQTVNGTVTVNGLTNDPDSPSKISASIVNGNINLRGT